HLSRPLSAVRPGATPGADGRRGPRMVTDAHFFLTVRAVDRGAFQPARMFLRKGQKDSLGNELRPPPGTVPIRRPTLDRMTRSRTLKEFLGKDRGRLGADSRSPSSGDQTALRTATRSAPSRSPTSGAPPS